MLQTQTANLPPDQQRRLHPEFLANEQAYPQMRDSLVAQYRGQWVAVHGGSVIAAGTELMAVMDRASAAAGHPYVALVGAEDAVVFRVRRVVFDYDQAYRPFPLPRLTATFSNHLETHSRQHAERQIGGRRLSRGPDHHEFRAASRSGDRTPGRRLPSRHPPERLGTGSERPGRLGVYLESDRIDDDLVDVL